MYLQLMEWWDIIEWKVILQWWVNTTRSLKLETTWVVEQILTYSELGGLYRTMSSTDSISSSLEKFSALVSKYEQQTYILYVLNKTEQEQDMAIDIMSISVMPQQLADLIWCGWNAKIWYWQLRDCFPEYCCNAMTTCRWNTPPREGKGVSLRVLYTCNWQHTSLWSCPLFKSEIKASKGWSGLIYPRGVNLPGV